MCIDFLGRGFYTVTEFLASTEVSDLGEHNC